jgi:hypothetical protein
MRICVHPLHLGACWGVWDIHPEGGGPIIDIQHHRQAGEDGHVSQAQSLLAGNIMSPGMTGTVHPMYRMCIAQRCLLVS